MARGIEGNEVYTPKPAAKKTTASSKSEKGQRSIVSFFQRAATSTPKAPCSAAGQSSKRTASPLTPAPSSDAVDPLSQEHEFVDGSKNKENGLPSPVTPVEDVKDTDHIPEGVDGKVDSSPSRKVRCSCCRPGVRTLLTLLRPRRLSITQSPIATMTRSSSHCSPMDRTQGLQSGGNSVSKTAKMSLKSMLRWRKPWLKQVRLSAYYLRYGTDDTQRILMASSFPTTRKKMHHGLRNEKGHHPQTFPNKHHVLRPNRTSVTMTKNW